VKRTLVAQKLVTVRSQMENPLEHVLLASLIATMNALATGLANLTLTLEFAWRMFAQLKMKILNARTCPATARPITSVLQRSAMRT
jgi:hypothetical protein